ncbi:MAG: extracellular solute-binding protein, partial [Nitriliruptorales bacterium]|nr:extracellular solute-binding protein [Nitriliruptorales bacterium]
LSQEAAAGFPGADVVSMNAAPLTALDDQGLLLPLNTPTTANLSDNSVFENWAATWLNVYTVAWNTDLVEPARVPESWEDVLAFQGNAGWKPRDWDWMGTLVLDHFADAEGRTEEEAIDLFRAGAEDAQAIDGHTVMVEFLAAGELELAVSAYHHTVSQFMARGAPLEWQPAVEPMVALPDGIAVTRDAQRPATGLLFIDFMLTRGQEMLSELGRTPASPNVEGGIPADVDVILVNFGVIEDREKWEGVMDEIIQN